jgi:succinyl-CoA synthetase beta subunit
MGGPPIERLLRDYPESVKKIHVDAAKGINLFDFKKAAEDLGCPAKASSLSFIFRNIYEIFVQRDCLDVTINPLALTPKNEFRAMSCRIEIDDDA